MERWKTDDPCANVDDLARSMPTGLSINLLSQDLDLSLGLQTSVLGCEVVYRDKSFAIVRYGDTSWMVHADTAYSSHPMAARLESASKRGNGCEIRLHGCDPDHAQHEAESYGFEVMAATKDKPHGLREVFLIDPDGYIWVPSVLKAGLTSQSAA